MKNGNKIVFWVGVYIVVAYGGYMLYANTKGYLANGIKKLGASTGTTEFLKGLDKDFLKAWYRAAKSNAGDFLYMGARYRTKGGTKIK